MVQIHLGVLRLLSIKVMLLSFKHRKKGQYLQEP